MISTRNPIKPLIVREKSYATHAVVVFALWVLAMSMDYADEMREERDAATQAAEIYEHRIKLMKDCEEKRITGYYYQDKAFVCPQEV